MNCEIGRLILGAGVVLFLAASASQAWGDCNDARSVALDIVGGTPTSSDPIEQSVIAELDASHISVCAAATEASGLARVEIRAARPDWQRASIRFESARAVALERELDVSKLPPEARALAIASATDELVRAALVDSSTVALGRATPDTQPAAPPPHPAPAALESDRGTVGRAGAATQSARPAIELGLGFGVSSYRGQREALEADVMARYWVLPRLPLTAALGLGHRLSRPPERGEVQADGDFHGSLAAGWLLWSNPGRFELVGAGGLHLSRVGFDERVRVVAFDRAPGVFDSDVESRIHTEENSLDHGWALGARLGVEGRAQAGLIGSSLALTGLAPLVGARSDWGDQTSLDAWGVQLHAGVWLAFDSRPSNLPARREIVAKGSLTHDE